MHLSRKCRDLYVTERFFLGHAPKLHFTILLLRWDISPPRTSLVCSVCTRRWGHVGFCVRHSSAQTHYWSRLWLRQLFRLCRSNNRTDLLLVTSRDFSLYYFLLSFIHLHGELSWHCGNMCSAPPAPHACRIVVKPINNSNQYECLKWTHHCHNFNNNKNP